MVSPGKISIKKVTATGFGMLPAGRSRMAENIFRGVNKKDKIPWPAGFSAQGLRIACCIIDSHESLIAPYHLPYGIYVFDSDFRIAFQA